MMSLLGLLPSPPAEVREGRVMFDGRDLLRCSPKELREVRGLGVGFIFQDPMTSLNPVFTVGFQIMEPLRRHLGMNKAQARKRARRNCWSWSTFPMPRNGLATIRTSFRAACGSG